MAALTPESEESPEKSPLAVATPSPTSKSRDGHHVSLKMPVLDLGGDTPAAAHSEIELGGMDNLSASSKVSSQEMPEKLTGGAPATGQVKAQEQLQSLRPVLMLCADDGTGDSLWAAIQADPQLYSADKRPIVRQAAAAALTLLVHASTVQQKRPVCSTATFSGDAADGKASARAAATETRKKRMCEDIRDDVKRRAPHYVDDWLKGYHRVIISASSFMFFTSFFPALIFGEQLHTATNGLMGIPDVLLSTGMTGVVWSLFSGQPLIIVGVTGPVAIFTTAAYGIAEALETDFFRFHAWICIWAALMHFFIAINGYCSAVKRVTNFAGETFAFFIAAIYIYSACSELFDFTGEKDFLHAAMDGWLGFGSFYLAITLHYARDWTFFTRTIREIIAQYGAAVAIVTWTLVAAFGPFHDAEPDLLDVPEESNFQPTARKYPFANGTNENCGQYCHSEETYTGELEFEDFCSETRSWLINPFADPDYLAVAVAFPCGGLLTLLFFFDHNVSSLLAQDATFKLLKGSAFHYDFLVLGCNVLLCGLLGIPTANGLIPQAPLHVRALSRISVKDDGHGKRTEVFDGVQEQRLSNLLQSLMMVLVMFYFDAPGLIPKAVLQGIFLYMGVTTLDGLTFWQRTQMLIQEPELIPKYPFLKDQTAKTRTIVRNYTLLQLFIWACIFGISGPWSGAISIVFPFLIAALVPMREYVLPMIFGADEVQFIDSCGEPAET